MTSDAALTVTALAFAAMGVVLIEITNRLLGNEKLVVEEAWALLARRKKWWLGPIAVMLSLVLLLMLFTTWAVLSGYCGLF